MKKNMYKSQKGITLVSLVVTIVVLLIIAGITVNMGLESIERAELDELKTDMLLVEAKATQLVEEANFKVGIISEPPTEEQKQKIIEVKKEIYVTKAKLNSNISDDGSSPEIKIPNVSDDILKSLYILTDESKELWGLQQIRTTENEKYLVKLDEKNMEVEVYNTKGFNNKYILSELKDLEA